MSDFLFGLPFWLVAALPFLYLAFVFLLICVVTCGKRDDELIRRAADERKARASIYGDRGGFRG